MSELRLLRGLRPLAMTSQMELQKVPSRRGLQKAPSRQGLQKAPSLRAPKGRSNLGVYLVILGFPLLAFAAEWTELKGDHFIIYYQRESAFPHEVLQKAEIYYQQVSLDLGYQRYSNFWQWDKRVKIFIYDNREKFLEETGEQEWSHGVARYRTKEIITYDGGEGFLNSLLPHEITHLIFRDYVGFEGEVPLWLDEGVAQWQEPKKRKVVTQLMKSVLRDGKAYPIEALTALDIREEKDPAAVQIFYMQAVSVVDFLIRRYGSENFTAFCRELRDGKSLNDSLSHTYPVEMRNLKELEEQWKEYVSEIPIER